MGFLCFVGVVLFLVACWVFLVLLRFVKCDLICKKIIMVKSLEMF